MGWKWCVQLLSRHNNYHKIYWQLTVSHFSMSRINPCSSLSVILSIRWSSSKTTLSIGIWKNGSELHPGWLDHDMTMVLAMAALAKNSHECDMLHLKPHKSGTVGDFLYYWYLLFYMKESFSVVTLAIIMYLNVQVLKKSLPLILMDLAPNTAVIRSGSFHAHGNKQKLQKWNKEIVWTSVKWFNILWLKFLLLFTYQTNWKVFHLIISSQEEFKFYCLPINIYLSILY